MSLENPENEFFKRVLFLSSYSPSFPTFNHQLEGLRSVFDPEKILLDVEFMDSKRFPAAESRDSYLRYLEGKSGLMSGYDLIFAADDNALRFCLDNRENMFKGIPLVFFGVNNIEFALSLNPDPLVTGLIEAVSMKETVDLIPVLFPDISEVVVVTDGTSSGSADYENCRRIFNEHPDLKMERIDLSGMGWDEFPAKLMQLGEDSVILLLSAYIDKTGEARLFEESLNLITSGTERPVFHLWYHGIGEGILGGKLISMYEQARSAALTGLRVLSGEDIAEIEISSEAENYYIFDFSQLRRFGIKLRQLPPGSTVYNSPLSFYHEHKRLFFTAAGIFIFLNILLVSSVLNIKARCKTEDALRESEAQYRSLFSDSRSVMMLIDAATGCVVDANAAASDFYGYNFEKSRNFPLARIDTLKTDELENRISSAAAGKAPVFYARHCISDGSFRDVEIYNSPIYYRGRECLYVIVHDVTEKVRMQQLIQEARCRAEDALKVKDDFLANISHELRTPLNGVMGMQTLLADADYSPRERLFFELSTKAAGNLKTVIEDLLDFTQSETGKLTINRTFFDISQIIGLSVDSHREPAAAKGLTLAVRKNISSRFFYCDESRLLQILNNLISNAVKYSDSGRISLEAAEEENRLRLRVRDEGIGISDDKFDEIFEPFRQLEEPFTKLHQGAGLGLAIVKSIVEALDAEIAVESETGKGTVFTVVIAGEFTNDPDKDSTKAVLLSDT